MKELRSGYTTGTCAAAAATAAALVLSGHEPPKTVKLTLPNGDTMVLPVLRASGNGSIAEAAVRKDAGDDPDVTDGVEVVVTLQKNNNGEITFAAGDGVGTVTKPGLQVPPGEAAINPVPREMIEAAIRQVTSTGVIVTVSIPGGRELAAKTFNPRLGIVGGLSILGTTGRVRPFSCPALRQSLKCALDVAIASGVRALVLVPGHYGERAARSLFRVSEEQIVQVSNEWGYMLDEAKARDLDCVLLVGHPGKLVKLAAGYWDTHSSRSPGAVSIMRHLAPPDVDRTVFDANTTEEIARALSDEGRRRLFDIMAQRIREAVERHLSGRFRPAVVLINLQGALLGASGDLTPWR